MKDVFGLIYTSDESDVRLRDLTRSRSIAAMPIGGRYRVIDVLLSNMVHSDITNVGLITQRNYHSLMDHLESGKAWDLNRKRDGLFILPLFAALSQVFMTKVLTPKQKDDAQAAAAAQQNPMNGAFMKWFMPLLSLWWCAGYNAAFAIYWCAVNIIQIAQSFFINLYFERKDRKAAEAAQIAEK